MKKSKDKFVLDTLVLAQEIPFTREHSLLLDMVAEVMDRMSDVCPSSYAFETQLQALYGLDVRRYQVQVYDSIIVYTRFSYIRKAYHPEKKDLFSDVLTFLTSLLFAAHPKLDQALFEATKESFVHVIKEMKQNPLTISHEETKRAYLKGKWFREQKIATEKEIRKTSVEDIYAIYHLLQKSVRSITFYGDEQEQKQKQLSAIFPQQPCALQPIYYPQIKKTLLEVQKEKTFSQSALTLIFAYQRDQDFDRVTQNFFLFCFCLSTSSFFFKVIREEQSMCYRYQPRFLSSFQFLSIDFLLPYAREKECRLLTLTMLNNPEAYYTKTRFAQMKREYLATLKRREDQWNAQISFEEEEKLFKKPYTSDEVYERIEKLTYPHFLGYFKLFAYQGYVLLKGD